MDSPIYRLSDVAKATGLSVGTLRSWLQRGHWRVDMAIGDSPAEIAGKAHLITLRRALQIGVAAELIRNNVEPARAFEAARSFSDHANRLELGSDQIGPGELFPAPAWTLLIVYPERSYGVVKRIDRRTPMQDILFSGELGAEHSGVFVWLNQVDKQVRTGLAHVGADV